MLSEEGGCSSSAWAAAAAALTAPTCVDGAVAGCYTITGGVTSVIVHLSVVAVQQNTQTPLSALYLRLLLLLSLLLLLL
jgi:MFS-type transporter involved in bile tolerance (Atg22 family)